METTAPARVTLSGFIEIGSRRMRQCARINLQLAREARTAGNARKLSYHIGVALRCRRDANQLQALHH